MIVFRVINNIVRTRLVHGNQSDLLYIRKVTRFMNYCNVFNVGNQDTRNITKRKKNKSVEILLLREDNSVTFTNLESAEKLAKHQNLKLIKTSELKSNKPVYKLSNIMSLIKTEQKSGVNKSEKQILISNKITRNDLIIKIRNIIKQLTKGHDVKIILLCDHKQEKINLEIIEKEIQGCGKIAMQTKRNNNILLLIKPCKDEVKL